MCSAFRALKAKRKLFVLAIGSASILSFATVSYNVGWNRLAISKQRYLEKKIPKNSEFIWNPSDFSYRDLQIGWGPPVQIGNWVRLHFVGHSSESNRIIETTMRVGYPPKHFEVGNSRGTVIEGIDKGIIGMHKGGRRVLLLPPSLTYPHLYSEVLIYEVIVLSVSSTKDTHTFGEMLYEWIQQARINRRKRLRDSKPDNEVTFHPKTSETNINH